MIVHLLVILLLLAIGNGQQTGQGSIVPCNELHLRSTTSCKDLVCGDYLLSGSNTIQVPASRGICNHFNKLPTAFRWKPKHFWVDSPRGRQTLNLEISYDWTADGVYDRVETLKPLALRSGNQRWYTVVNSDGLQSVTAGWSNLFSGSVRIRMWVVGTSPVHVGADSKTYITIPFKSTNSAPLPAGGQCSSGTNFPTTGSCNCVAFRLNGVQDFYLSPAQQAIINVFKTNKVPLTLGIIGSRFGQDSDLVQTVRMAAQDPSWQIELASNGYNPDGMGDLTLAQQEQQLLQFNTWMFNMFGINATTFIPPSNEINDFTIPAMKSFGYTHLSTSRINDPSPYAMQGSKVYRFPAGAFTYDLSNYQQGVSAHTTWNQIQTQLDIDGFATGGDVHPNMIAELTTLLQMVKTNGVRPVPLSKVNTDASNDSVPKIDFKSCNCVAFRLDDIQDWFLTAPQKAIIDLFKEENIPITVGVIGDYFGEDTTIVNYIRSTMEFVANNPLSCFKFEIANHGFQHEDFSTFSLSEQVSLLANSNAKISTALGVVPKTFIPPFNSYNQDTISALAAQSFSYFSSQDALDKGPYNFEDPTLWRFPIGCSTGRFEDYVGVEHTVTWSQIQTQLSRDGFAAVMMHPQEFSTYGANNLHENSVNETMMQELRSLLRTVKQSGLSVVAISSIKDYFGLTNDPCATPSSTERQSTTSTSAVGSTTESSSIEVELHAGSSTFMSSLWVPGLILLLALL